MGAPAQEESALKGKRGPSSWPTDTALGFRTEARTGHRPTMDVPPVRVVSPEVPVGPADGIRVESVVNLDYTLLARTCVIRRVGRATPTTMSRLCRALAHHTPD